MESNTILYKPLGDVIELLTDYHANGAYEKLKENVTLLDKENHAVMIRTTNFEANDFTNNLIYIDEHAYEFLKKSKVYASDLIMNKIANPGTVYFMPEISKPVSLGMNLFLIRVNPKKANPYFIYAYLRKNEHYVKSFASGSTTKTITKDDVRRLKIFMPPLQEQNKTAQILSTWDQAISATEKLLENSQQQKKALMQQLLTGKKRLLDENGVRFSGEWQTFSLDSLFFFKKGKGLSKDSISETGQNKCILYGELYTKYSEVIDEIVSKTDSSEATLSMKGDILIPSSTTTSGIDLANATALLEENILLGGDINILRPKGEISSEFMAYLLTHIKKYDIASRAQGITIIHLYGSDLKDIEVQIPVNVQEQKKIAKFLSIVEKEMNVLQGKIVCLNKEKKALMQQLLTGKKRVKVGA
ncbi:restriction endonuclease subunit S [Acinetobacter baumannii]